MLKRWYFFIGFLVFSLFVVTGIVIAATCTSGETRSCGSSSVGDCRLGQQECVNGSWSLCRGAVYASVESCFDEHDNDCDGLVDENCQCVDGAQESCGNSSIGICKLGTRSCMNNSWSACSGAILPLPSDICNDGFDNDCDGFVDEQCQALPSCVDQVKNQGELGVDCGGPCAVCSTCSDGIKNQNEVAVDCGGVCPACVSCIDGLQNQNESGVDCGGPCAACVVADPDGDTDGLSVSQELLLGTSDNNPDSDVDGIFDAVDTLPLCPNRVCDLNFGESVDNCPLDCPKEKKYGIWYALGVIIVLF
ncbi:MAG: MopE-related protein [Nanoarchaeota archaeon]|nr:MopE-related protein [Nanoarchaeota archaeon]